MIDVKIETIKSPAGTSFTFNLIKVIGEVDATNSVVVQQKVLPISLPGCRIILDLSKVSYMSSAGLRMLLSFYRQTSSNNGQIVLVGVTDELKDTMSMTGFLGYFIIQDTLESGMNAFRS
ncbi:MAG: anti-sigma factor antagonist [Chloroflexota bacterium]